MSIGIGTTSTINLTSDEFNSFNSSLNLVSGRDKTIDSIISSLKSDISSKEEQLEQLKNLLLLTKETVDGYSQLIVPMDRDLPSLVEEINERVRNLGAAYSRRIQQQYLSDLRWELKQESVRAGVCNGITTDVRYQFWEVVKDFTTFQKAEYYGVQYYRRPRNRDYNSSFSREIRSGFVGVGSDKLTIFDIDGDSRIRIGDYITDDLDDPYVYDINDLPRVINIEPIESLGITTSIVGSISAGSTELQHTGVGIVTFVVNEGDTVSKPEILSPNTLVVGFGNTDIEIDVIDGSGLSGVNTSTVTTIILSNPAIGSTSDTIFEFGNPLTYYSLTLDRLPVNGGITTNFFVISARDVDDEKINFTNGGVNPIQLGILDDENKLGYGHSLRIVNNGSDIQSTSWNEFSGPEPLVGAGYSVYYIGKQEWPTITISGVTEYAELGTKITFHLCPTEVGINTGISFVSPNPPSISVIDQLNQDITTSQNELNQILSVNIPKIESFLEFSDLPRELRDSKESLAWGFETSVDGLRAELAKLNRQLKTLSETDYSEFYP